MGYESETQRNRRHTHVEADIHVRFFIALHLIFETESLPDPGTHYLQ